MAERRLTIGSRGSALALWQARWVQERLSERGIESDIRRITTTGDRITDVPLARVGTKGLFTKEIEEALLAGEVDLAVHSLKDLPTEQPRGLVLTAYPEREDPRDAMVGARLAGLPTAARVGTSSLRRAAQLHALRPDLVVESIRGNVDTRLRKLDEGQFEAIVLAAAGLNRLGLGGRVAEVLPASVMCPAVGQGALAVETRDDDGEAARLCRALDHPATRAAVTAERAMLAALGGGCQVPVGAFASVSEAGLTLQGVVVSPDGRQVIRAERAGLAAEAAALGTQLGEELVAQGGGSILEKVYGVAAAQP